MRTIYLTCLIYLFLSAVSCVNKHEVTVDVLVIGGSVSGISSGIQAARMGVNTLVVEESEWLGGMLTAAGVSAVGGNYQLPAGIWGEFRSQLALHYGGLDSLKTGWVSNVLFEPSVGNEIFHRMVETESHLQVWKGFTLCDIKKTPAGWCAEVVSEQEGIKTIYTKVLIDATELGDVAKRCGVKYDIGMESRHQTQEDIAPEKENNILQDLTYVAVLKDYGKDVTIPQPANYNPAEFACSCANSRCVSPKEPGRVWSKEKLITYGKLPNNKYMINWPIEGNDFYANIIELSETERKAVLEQAKQRTLRFLYFIQKELGFNTLSLADDEFPTADKLPLIPYHRESRRIHGLVRFTLNHMTHPFDQVQKLYRTSVAVGDYPVDHHHTRYQCYEDLPNLYFYPVPSFGLPLGTLIPKDVDDLIVAEKSISVSNIANGATRLQPVVLQIGQAAGALAALAVVENKPISQVGVRQVQQVILDAKGYLLPYLDVLVDDVCFQSYQRIGSTGILKGEGRNVDWSNQTWLRVNDVLLTSELQGLEEIYPYVQFPAESKTISLKEAIHVLKLIVAMEGMSDVNVDKKITDVWEAFNLGDMILTQPILRGQMAVLLDQIVDPFHRKAVDLEGFFIE